MVLGEQEATVADVRPFDLHGVTYYDVTVVYPDHTAEQARLGPEAVPDQPQVLGGHGHGDGVTRLEARAYEGDGAVEVLPLVVVEEGGVDEGVQGLGLGLG